MTIKPQLGEMLIEEGLLDRETLNRALRIQVGGNRRLGTILVRMKDLSEDQLAEILAKQLQIPITEIEGQVSRDVHKIIPRYLCKKYEVLPLKLGPNNTIEVAMADPSDDQTIRDLEQFTGRAVNPKLARQSEISAGIKKYIPFSLADLIAPQASTVFTRVAVAVCLALVVSVGIFTYKYIQHATYGTVSKTAEATIYKNHDLMLAFNSDGKINLLGRGAYADGYYSIAFNSTAVLETFLQSKEKDLSEKQMEWLSWVITQNRGRKLQAVVSN